jgi:hypothetical protein
MKTLSFDEMKRVSGAGHFGDVRDANMGKSNKNTGSNNKGNTGYYNNLGQDVTNCNNGIIGGMPVLLAAFGSGDGSGWWCACRRLFFSRKWKWRW